MSDYKEYHVAPALLNLWNNQIIQTRLNIHNPGGGGDQKSLKWIDPQFKQVHPQLNSLHNLWERNF